MNPPRRCRDQRRIGNKGFIMTQPNPQLEIVQDAQTDAPAHIAARPGKDRTGGSVPPEPGAVPDLWTYRAVVVVLALVLVAPVIGELAGREITDSTAPLVSAALGALAGLLAPSPTRHR
jgi:hypothetical protein